MLTDDDSDYDMVNDQARDMTMRRKLQHYTGGSVFKTVQNNSKSPSGDKPGLPSTTSALANIPIALHIEQMRSTHEESVHMRYPSSKFNSIGIINPNSEINDRIWK